MPTKRPKIKKPAKAKGKPRPKEELFKIEGMNWEEIENEIENGKLKTGQVQ